MKIAIDLRPLQIGHQNRGIGVYLNNILRYFPVDDTVEYIFLRYSESNPITDYGIGNSRQYKEVVVNRYKYAPNLKAGAMFLWGLVNPIYIRLLPHRPDIFFQPDYLLGIPGKLFAKKTIVMCYDLIPLRLKAMYLPSWRKFAGMRHLRLRLRLRQSLRAYYYTRKYKRGLRTFKRASRVISISNTTTNDLLHFTRVKKSRVSTIYLAPSYLSLGNEINKLPRELDGIQYIFYIGGGDKRRQITSLISAFNKLNARDTDIHLVLAGNEFVEGSKDMSANVKTALALSSYSDKIHLMGVVSEGVKYELMKNAAVFAYPSLYEGFGLPIVEAMLAGTPVVTYRNSSIEEIGNNVLFYAKPNSESLRKAILGVLKMDSKKMLHITELAKIKAESFSWDRSGGQTINLFKAND